jgi:hypothetical protein
MALIVTPCVSSLQGDITCNSLRTCCPLKVQRVRIKGWLKVLYCRFMNRHRDILFSWLFTHTSDTHTFNTLTSTNMTHVRIIFFVQNDLINQLHIKQFLYGHSLCLFPNAVPYKKASMFVPGFPRILTILHLLV